MLFLLCAPAHSLVSLTGFMAKRQAYQSDGQEFATNGAALSYVRAIRERYEDSQVLSAADQAFMVVFFALHPNRVQNRGAGVAQHWLVSPDGSAQTRVLAEKALRVILPYHAGSAGEAAGRCQRHWGPAAPRQRG